VGVHRVRARVHQRDDCAHLEPPAGVHRFEEMIHSEFEKLVGMGFLKLKV
jgi:hypothetical protein